MSLRYLATSQYQRITAQEAFSTTEDETGQSREGALMYTQESVTSIRCSPSPPRAQTSWGSGRTWAFPVSAMRLVPKEHGTRAIVNLSKGTRANRDRVQWIKGVPLPVRRRR